MSRIAIDAWDPGYGTGAADPVALEQSDVPTDTDVEVPLADWRPLQSAAAPWPAVVFVDGVQRIDARAWVTDDDGVTRQGLCATVAAGAVRCDGSAEVLDVLVDRFMVAPVEGARHLATRHGTWRHITVSNDEAEVLDRAIGRVRGEAEAAARRSGGDHRRSARGRRSAQPAPSSRPRPRLREDTAARLRAVRGPPCYRRADAGDRTPVFVVGESVARWSWYLRLPGPVVHPLAVHRAV